MSATGVISGKVVAIFYQNPSNFFKVLLVKVAENDLEYDELEIVITGSFGEVQEGEEYRFTGELVNHPKYGRQMKAESYQQAQPTSAAGLIYFLPVIKFLASGAKRQKIVDALGEGPSIGFWQIRQF